MGALSKEQHDRLWQEMVARSFDPRQWYAKDDLKADHDREPQETIMWVYKQTESGMFTVGHYDPKGNWCADSDHPTKEQAATRVNYLNGGGSNAGVSAVAQAARRGFKS